MKDPNVVGPEDYSNFSLEALEKDIHRIHEEVKQKTGATEDQMAAAWLKVSLNIMDINCMKEPWRHADD